MGGKLGRRHPVGKRVGARPHRQALNGVAGNGRRALGKDQGGLTAADELEINFGQELGIEQSTVADALGIVDAIAAAQGIEARPIGWRWRQATSVGRARQQQAAVQARQLGIEEPEVGKLCMTSGASPMNSSKARLACAGNRRTVDT